jgi:hypothetical protein
VSAGKGRSQAFDAIVTQSKTDRKRLDSAALGVFSLTALGIASAVGAGIFATTGTAVAEFAGPSVVISFVLAGIAAAAMAVSPPRRVAGDRAGDLLRLRTPPHARMAEVRRDAAPSAQGGAA